MTIHVSRGMGDVLTFRPKPDRRAPDRLVFPLCRVCGFADAVVVMRALFVIWVRCCDCGDLRAIKKPRSHVRRRASGQ